jgi:hypothetical protein
MKCLILVRSHGSVYVVILIDSLESIGIYFQVGND